MLYFTILELLSFLLWGSTFNVVIGWVCHFAVDVYFVVNIVDYNVVAVIVYISCYCYSHCLRVCSYQWMWRLWLYYLFSDAVFF